jgi:hypothetical protein
MLEQGRSHAEILRACYGVEFPVEFLVLAEMFAADAEPPGNYPLRPWELLTPLARGGPRAESNILDDAQQRLDPSLIALVSLYDGGKHGEKLLCYRRDELAAGRSTIFALRENVPDGAEAKQIGDSLGAIFVEHCESRVQRAEDEYNGPYRGRAGAIDWGEVEHEHECLARADELVNVTALRLANTPGGLEPSSNTRSLERGLIAAAKKNDVPRLRELISLGAPIDPVEGEDSALIIAIMESHLAATRCLLEAGAKLNHRGRYDLDPLERACRSSDLATIELVIDSGASVKSPALLSAATLRPEPALAASILALLVRRGIDPNFSSAGWTILMAVCLFGDLESARSLLDRGADPNAGEAGTPLSIAKERGHEVLVDLLLERGAVK